MVGKIIALLTTCFRDPQSQCESQVRTLRRTMSPGGYRRPDGQTDREAVIRNLRENVNDLTDRTTSAWPCHPFLGEPLTARQPRSRAAPVLKAGWRDGLEFLSGFPVKSIGRT